jgi:hypothetical protein
VDDFITCIIPTTKQQVEHVARGILHRIHDVFPPSKDDGTDPISNKKLRKGKGTFETSKCLPGFEFDRLNKSIWLEEEKWASLLQILHQWIRGAAKGKRGIPFAEFESIIAKLRHAFTALREGRGLLSPCNWVIQKRPKKVYLHKDGTLLEAISDVRTILQASTKCPTQCKDLVADWPDYIGIVDASSHGVGGVVIGELSEITPTVFRLQINKLLNKLSQFLLRTKWIDEGLFDCRDLHHSKVATGRREHLPDGNVSPFGNNPANQMSGWIASNRLRV